MTELGVLFLLALADQGYGLVITDEDVNVLRSDLRTRHIFPVELFEEPDLEFLLEVAITAFIINDGRFYWPSGERGAPGTN